MCGDEVCAACAVHTILSKKLSSQVFVTSTKGTIGPGRRPLAYLLYYVIMVSPACA